MSVSAGCVEPVFAQSWHVCFRQVCRLEGRLVSLFPPRVSVGWFLCRVEMSVSAESGRGSLAGASCEPRGFAGYFQLKQCWQGFLCRVEMSVSAESARVSLGRSLVTSPWNSVDNVCFRRVCRERLLIPLIFPLGVKLTMSVSARLVKVLILRVGGCIFIRNKDGSSTHARIIVSRSFPPAHPSHKTHPTCKVQNETCARLKMCLVQFTPPLLPKWKFKVYVITIWS